jgi:hypothetical protein
MLSFTQISGPSSSVEASLVAATSEETPCPLTFSAGYSVLVWGSGPYLVLDFGFDLCSDHTPQASPDRF